MPRPRPACVSTCRRARGRRAGALVAVLAAWVAAAGAHAQPPPSVAFDVPLPGTLSGSAMTVYGVAQDVSGYLWVASEEGLHRYDGVAFDAFRADPDDPRAIPGNRVTGVAAAPDGSVWAFVDRFGLVRYTPATGRLDRFSLPAALRHDGRIAVDGDGQVWLTRIPNGTVVDGVPLAGRLVRFDPERRRVVYAAQPSDIVATHVDAAGQAWVQRPDGFYRRQKEAGWRRYPFAASAEWVPARAPTVLADGRLFRYDDERDRFAPVPDPGGLVLGLGPPALVDASGLLWAMDANRRLVAADLAAGRAVRYTPDPARADAIPDGDLYGLFADADGVVWLSTALGLRTVRPGWQTFHADLLPRTAFPHFLSRGASGTVWGGNACEAPWALLASRPDARVPLEVRAPAVARALSEARAAWGFCVSDVTEAPDGSFWFAGWPFSSGHTGGVLHVRPDGRATRYRVGAEPSPDAVRRVHVDRAGRAWAASEAGLVRLDADGSTRIFTAADGLPATIVWTVDDAPGDALWVGTYGGGLVLFDAARGTVQRVYRHDPDDASTLSSDVVTAVRPDPDDPQIVWVGTYDGGLNRLDVRTGRVRRFTRRDGLPDLTVKSLLHDARGDLWIGTAAGLVWMRPSTGETRTYTEADGLPGLTFGLYDLARLPGGSVAAIVDDHVLTFDPLAVRPSRLDAGVVLRRLRVGGQLRALPPPGEPVRLEPGERSLGVEVAALSFVAPTGLRYAVRLEGFDGWTPLGADRTAAWGRLPPGRYTLRARAATASGAWGERELAVPVVVVPAWWERAAVRGTLLALLLAGFALAVRALSQRRLRGQVAALERERASARRLHRERERISRDLHDHVGAQLASLLAGVDLARLARGSGDGAAPTGPPTDPLDAIEEDARETIRQLRETIWALHHEALRVDAFCDRLRADAARLVRGRAQPRVTVGCGECGHVLLSPMQALHLYRIAQEALTNAVKHASAPHVEVAVACHEGHVTVSVHDDGTFGQATTGEAAGPSGFGMGSMRARADALGATFRVDTRAGTRIAVEVPREAVAEGVER